jgi:hypothetical protein
MKKEKLFREKYPYLAAWKKECYGHPKARWEKAPGKTWEIKLPQGAKMGWWRMPGHPPPPLDPAKEEAYWQSYKESLTRPSDPQELHRIGFRRGNIKKEVMIPRHQYTEEDADALIESFCHRGPITPEMERSRKIMWKATLMGLEDLRLLSDVVNGRITRKEAVERLISARLPSKQGSSVIPSVDVWVVLWKNYKEMQEAVREIRRAMDIPLLMRAGEEGDEGVELEGLSEDLRDMKPEDIFTPDEIPIVTGPGRVRDICKGIMYQRIASVPGFVLSESTFNRNLDEIKRLAKHA